MKVIGIVAMNPQGIIGKGNELPWKCPKDLQWFKAQTHRCVVIMGRKTFESIGRPLPDRLNIVISRTPRVHAAPNVRYVTSMEDALFVAKILYLGMGYRHDQCFVMGGAEIYHLFEDVIDEWLITRINVTYPDPENFVSLNESSLFQRHTERTVLMVDQPGADDNVPLATYYVYRPKDIDNNPK